MWWLKRILPNRFNRHTPCVDDVVGSDWISNAASDYSDVEPTQTNFNSITNVLKIQFNFSRHWLELVIMIVTERSIWTCFSCQRRCHEQQFSKMVMLTSFFSLSMATVSNDADSFKIVTVVFIPFHCTAHWWLGELMGDQKFVWVVLNYCFYWW